MIEALIGCVVGALITAGAYFQAMRSLRDTINRQAADISVMVYNAGRVSTGTPPALPAELERPEPRSDMVYLHDEFGLDVTERLAEV